MTLEEKVDMLSGPKGLFGATVFPSGVSMAARWDPDLVQQEGKAVGQRVGGAGATCCPGQP
jgi:beta-glucosidase-like glycosyl hydrolase